MSARKDKISNEALDRALAALREDGPSQEQVDRAAERVWSRLTGSRKKSAPAADDAAPIRDCAGFRRLIPYYLSRSLTRSRMLLLDDHLRDCLDCRTALQKARLEMDPDASVIVPDEASWQASGRVWKLALAAMLVAVVGLSSWFVIYQRPDASGFIGTVEASEGGLFRVMKDVSSALTEGLQISSLETIRTAKDSGSVLRLADGSLIEMADRTELSISESGRGTTIHLARGSVIVRAADQGSGRLFLESGDASVAVKGTIFTVNRGTKGSRISVIEGEVEVAHGRAEDLLLPGDQISTHPSMGPVPVEEEIAWSRDLDRYVEILRELKKLQEQVEAVLTAADPRHDTRLLDALPRSTAIYASVPNIAENLAEAHGLFMEGVERNPALREWWQQSGAAFEGHLQHVIDRIGLMGGVLGEEVVIALALGGNDDMLPVAVAELTRPGELADVLEQLQSDIASLGEGGPGLRLVEDPWAVTSSGQLHDIYFWVEGDTLVVSPGLGQIRSVGSVLRGRADSLAGTDFHAHLSRVYDDGVEWLLGVDLAPLVGAVTSAAGEHLAGPAGEQLDRAGLGDLEYLVFERRTDEGVTHHKARLTFDNPRSGVASWLAEPAPMGALDFISPDAYMVAAFVMKEPSAVVRELLDMAGPGLREQLAAFEQSEQFDLVADFAAPLGGEFVVALDGPILPVPGIKVAIEVYDPATLQHSIERAVTRIDEELRAAGAPGVSLTQRQEKALTVHTLEIDAASLAVEYVYTDGYLVAAPSWVLLQQAVQRREAGHVLRHGSKFKSLLPRDAEVNFSALFYQDLGFLWGPLSQLAGGMLSPEQKQSLDALAAEADASMVYAYAEEDEILFASAAEGGLFGADLGTLVSLGTAGGIQQAMESAIAGRRLHEGDRAGEP